MIYALLFELAWDTLKKKAFSVSETIPDDWVVECTHVGQGDKALTYLGQYLYRGVLPEKNIIQNHDGKITFTYTDNTKNRRTRTLSGADFLWLLLQHVLPRGFRRARDFGFLHANCKRMIHFLQYVLRCFVPSKANALSKRAVFRCGKCGGVMKIIATRMESKRGILPCLVDP